MKFPIKEENKGSIRRTREFYGFPQDKFASYLKISRSHLAMIEVNERNGVNVNTIPLLKFMEHMSHAKNGKYADPLPDDLIKLALEKQEKDKLIFAERSLRDAKTILYFTQRSLDKLKAEQERSRMVLSVVPKLKENFEDPAFPLDEATLIDKESMIIYCEKDARKVQGKTGVDEQFKLELEIARLNGEIKFLEKYLGRLEN